MDILTFCTFSVLFHSLFNMTIGGVVIDPAIGIDRWATQAVSILMPAAALRCGVEVEGGGHTDLLHDFRSFSLFV